MADELICIVDETVRPVGSATKSEAWASGLVHRLVHVILEDKDGQLLLQQRASQKKLWPNCWTVSASGHVDAGEDYLTAAHRETLEELGINLTGQLDELGKFYFSDEFAGQKLERFNMVYKTVVEPSILLLKLQKSEVSATRWFSIDKIKTMARKEPELLTPSLIEIVQRYY